MNYNAVPAISYPAKTSLMDPNTAPMISDTGSHQKIAQDSINTVVTIITGTFCQKENSARMKKLIADQGFQLYEEKLQNECVRLGVLLTVNEGFENALLSIRNNIEPSAWVLTH